MKNTMLLILVAALITACGSQKNKVQASNSPAMEVKTNPSNDTGGRQPQILINSYAFLVDAVSTDSTYGYSPENAIKVGGSSEGEGPLNERRFLNALAGPNGEEIDYQRYGSCCPQPSKNSAFGSAVLDRYAVYYKGAQDTVMLYINMYDSEKLLAPVGFSLREFPN
ncbi:2-dehydro-3-deoxyphosphooctonate aldolase [Nonlabens xiamenensis]|uniref:2-dehydro-3-deoxyphosphooctonate aldolase n=1 Tax=Nonlabens xiamenensis TaxID=2341043 RepID=UPI000F6157D8|nr:2-dehydro-3-deoxyphosphooctonate aldolase [Nonlabens xiamenensis]